MGHVTVYRCRLSQAMAGDDRPRSRQAGRTADLLCSIAATEVPIPGSEWTRALVLEEVGRFGDTSAERRGDQPIIFTCGLSLDLARLACVSLGEQILHDRARFAVFRVFAVVMGGAPLLGCQR